MPVIEKINHMNTRETTTSLSSLPPDGVVLIDPEYLKDRKVFGHVLAAFRYGREDLDVLGLTFRKDLYLASEQIYPLDATTKRPLTRLQVCLNAERERVRERKEGKGRRIKRRESIMLCFSMRLIHSTKESDHMPNLSLAAIYSKAML